MSDRRAARWVQPSGLLAAAWATSTLTLPVPIAEWVPSSLGFSLGAAFAGLALVVGAARDQRFRGRLGQAARDAALPLGFVLVAALSSAAVNQHFLWRDIAKTAVLGMVGAAYMASSTDRATEEALGIAGAAMVLGFAAIGVAGLFLPGVQATAWSGGIHRVAGSLPRFRGLAGTPGAAGLWVLLGVGMARGLRATWLKRLVTAVGISLAVLSLSLATLCVPLLIVVRFARGRSLAFLAPALVLGSLAVLWVHLLTVRVADREIVVATPPPAYHEEGLGPLHHPSRTVRLGSLQGAGHSTAYGALALRGLTCFAAHPAFGVGPGRFADDCPAMTLGTYGGWFARREPHNQYTGFLAEHGVAGLLALAGAGWLLGRRRRWLPFDRWSSAAVSAALLSAAGGEVLFTFPVVAFVGVMLAPAGRGRRTCSFVRPWKCCDAAAPTTLVAEQRHQT